MSHNVYIYILVMAGVTYLIRVLPITLAKKGNCKSIYQIISLLRALRMPGCNDISGHPVCYCQQDLSSGRVWCSTDCCI